MFCRDQHILIPTVFRDTKLKSSIQDTITILQIHVLQSLLGGQNTYFKGEYTNYGKIHILCWWGEQAVGVDKYKSTKIPSTKDKYKKVLSEVGFEPTPTYVDQNTRSLFTLYRQGLPLSLAP